MRYVTVTGYRSFFKMFCSNARFSAILKEKQMKLLIIKENELIIPLKYRLILSYS